MRLRRSGARSLEPWGRSVLEVEFPITTGLVVAGFKAALTDSDRPYASAVKVQPKLPPDGQRALRMVTVRDDSGPDDGTQTRRRQGVNVWAETSVYAEHLALFLMAAGRSLPNGRPITATDQFSGPYEVTDDATDLLIVNGVTLSHFFFTFRLTARGTNF